ncbi:uncharacterized protein LACBIDRAFT_324497 [Laccaria bicolor S238N-H82]|uniref:Predicted protein n=1 Tax=Laccaria bicolor (strain S238N-H82 / ATCC MYA-4686) TaxID=486041 RepID=B0D204_LACBS|nr:uncharacterized protein LACBIDRAFT_324497 [Laccaria bicolor S238N-H82]EDR11734.1 predicted protein [Laccaria bicolor S238N-H82]|eukprot:XP_001877631.1 predicted protein [Laccaria bicolor S238N-H82]
MLISPRSTCTRCTPGYAVSGTAIVICSRHALIRRNGAGDLQKGKKYIFPVVKKDPANFFVDRYCNVDFIIFATLVGVMLPWIFITYDIGCQWSKNFRSHMSEFPEHMRLLPSTKVEVAVPSWHITIHGKRCQKDFCLGYMKGAGRTCGKEVKITWSSMNSLALSVREMAPGARHDTLNDQWNGWNFRKIISFLIPGTLFAKHFKEAALMNKKQMEIFEKFSSTFPPETVVKREQMVVCWEDDPKAPNPYDEPEAMTTLQDMRLQLTQKEMLELASGRKPKHKVTMMGYFSMGFDIEDQQFVLKVEISRLKGKKTSKQLADLEEKKSTLIRHIQIWRPIQLAYTPHVATLLPSLHTVDDGGFHYANQSRQHFFSLCCFHLRYVNFLTLDPDGAWKDRLKELRPTDLRGPGRDPDNLEDAKTSNEWAQTRARMSHWGEELLILQEEMRRVLAFFEWKAIWWLEQGNRRQGLEPSVHIGIVAYAHKQATICSHMAARCATYWLPVMKHYSIIPTWAERYKHKPGTPLAGDPSESSDSDSDSEHEVHGADKKSDVGEPNVDDIFDLD